MKLISEEVQNAEYLVEEKNGKKNYKIRGVFLQSEIKNRNGRVYEKEILEKLRGSDNFTPSPDHHDKGFFQRMKDMFQ